MADKQKRIPATARVIVERAEGFDDWNWWSVRLAEHNGVYEMRPYMDGTQDRYLYDSGRISDACVEGDSVQMLALAEAIENHGEVHFKRCAVEQVNSGMAFHSPRNSSVKAVLSLRQADELAADIRDKVKG